MIKDSQNMLYIFYLIAHGSLANAVGFILLCTNILLKIVGLNFNKNRCSVQLRSLFIKLTKGVKLITPEIGN